MEGLKERPWRRKGDLKVKSLYNSENRVLLMKLERELARRISFRRETVIYSLRAMLSLDDGLSFFLFWGVGPPTTLHSMWDLSSGIGFKPKFPVNQGSNPSPL